MAAVRRLPPFGAVRIATCAIVLTRTPPCIWARTYHGCSRPVSLSHLPPRSSRLPSPLPCPPRRAYSTLPVIEHHVPRKYPFPLVLTTELLAEEDLDQQPLTPHDLPPYKSTLLVSLLDLPLTPGERRIFRRLVGHRMASRTFHDHPTPSFLHRQKGRRWSPKGHPDPFAVRFVSRHLPSAEANENRVFQLLDECIRQSKVLAKAMEEDGEWVEMGEEEAVMKAAYDHMQRELWEERQRKRGKSTEEIEAERERLQLSADTTTADAPAKKEKVKVGRKPRKAKAANTDE